MTLDRDIRLLVCGGVEFRDFEYLIFALNDLRGRIRRISALIVGDLPGAEELAIAWAVAGAVVVETGFPLNTQHFGEAASAVRNKKMLFHGKPDLVMAFPGGETANMIEQATDANIALLVVPPKPYPRW